MPGPTPVDDPDRLPAARHLRAAGEAVLLALVALAPWPYASNDQPFELALSAGVLLLTALWAAHAALTRHFALRRDLPAVCLAGIALWSALQMVPLPESVVGAVSPTRLAWHRDLLPEQLEVLPGESEAVARPAWLPLTVDPAATRTFTARVVGVLLVYLTARNWLATRTSFRRLAGVLAANGAALAVFALAQFFTAPRDLIYWSVPVEGQGVFGPFVCRNHYPDYVALCAGLGAGLLLSRNWLSPLGLALAAAVGLMLASIPFSLSRGGVLATVAAALGAWLLLRGGRGRPGGLISLAAAAAIGLGLVAWFGSNAIESRLSTLSGASASRWPLWRDAARLLPGTWPAGTGAGTFQSVEPTVRTSGAAYIVYENAHNEYLEALVEGGVIRLGLTLLLAAGVLVIVGRGAIERRDRSVGPLLLGAWFGLAAVALHAVVDFGTHMPAVAVAVAGVAGYAVAGATDAAFVPRQERRDFEPESGPGLSGWAAVGVSLGVAVAALAVALDARQRDREERLRVRAEAAYWTADDPERFSRRIAFAEARASLRPDSADIQFDAAQAHLDAAIAATWAPAAGLAGGAAGFSATPDRFPPVVVERHLIPALRFLRAARAANPLAPKPHARLGLYAEHCRTAEPPAVHFDRAKRLLPNDEDLWFFSGREAARRGDLDAAWSDWNQSLTHSVRHLPSILREVRRRASGAELARRLPDDPVVRMAASRALDAEPDRRPLVESAARWAGRPDLSADQAVAVARACDELERTAEAEAAWRQALDRAPDRADVRDQYAAWLEREERYEEAIPHLEWLTHRRPAGQPLRDRLDAARHGLKLQRIIAGQLEPPR